MTYVKLDDAIKAVKAIEVPLGGFYDKIDAWLKAIDIAADALAALPTVSDGWEDIATAKQDGSAFYVWWPCWYHFPLIAYWKDYQLKLPDSTQPAPPWQLGEPNGPTHWKPLGPLPAPPIE